MRTATRMVVLGRKLWTPAALGSSLALWLDADDSSTITLNESTVSQWRDKSENGRHASQPNKASQPTYSLTGLNGRPVLTFDGVNDFMAAGTNSTWNFLHNGQESAAFVVARAGNTGENPNTAYTFLSNGGSATADVGLWWSYEDRTIISNNAFRILLSCGVSGSAAAAMTVNDQITPGAWNILGLRVDADNPTAENRSIGNVNGGIDFAINTFMSAPSTANSSFPLYLGVGVYNPYSPIFDAFLSGGMAEILIINGRISAYEQQQLTGYLAHKRGLTANLPSHHPFRFTPPFV